MRNKNRRKYSLWLYYVLSVAILSSALLSVTWYVTDRFRTFFVDQQRIALEVYARTVALDIEENGLPLSGFAEICNASKQTDKTLRLTLINTDGEVLCDSAANPPEMDNHGIRPEVLTAYAGETGSGIRFSNTLQATLLYVAVPLNSDDGVWVVRAARSLTAINDLLHEVFRKLFVVSVLLYLALFLVSYYLFRKINPPLYEIRQGAERFARGEFDRSLPDYQVKEISELANAMNQMATKLDSLENLRREFVANVSHELKTPVTTIKGFTETLLEGAKDDPADLERFLEIVSRQADRLADIIDDLLTLSRLESAPLSEVLALDWHDLCDILKACKEVCQSRADKKAIVLRVDCRSPVRIYVDYSLLMQATINLVDNAIKYSPEKTMVKIAARVDASHVCIDVSDEGPGIMEIHIPRLFERFYRADKARSRKLGGTGLGLAIVKHIANVHQGEVAVSSRVGSGSTFTILLPKKT
ncbi:MAG: HAMP domain-containing protein [Gammaproteobacteria bacterium]|nr:HAMP domain-containing protein [Gammaproteobacteria bacterium]